MSDETTTGVVTFPSAADVKTRARKQLKTREEELQELVHAQWTAIEGHKKVVAGFQRLQRAQAERLNQSLRYIRQLRRVIGAAAQFAKHKKWKDLTALLNACLDIEYIDQPAEVLDVPPILTEPTNG